MCESIACLACKTVCTLRLILDFIIFKWDTRGTIICYLKTKEKNHICTIINIISLIYSNFKQVE